MIFFAITIHLRENDISKVTQTYVAILISIITSYGSSVR